MTNQDILAQISVMESALSALRGELKTKKTKLRTPIISSASSVAEPPTKRPLSEWNLFTQKITLMVKESLGTERMSKGLHLKVASHLKNQGIMEPSLEQVSEAIDTISSKLDKNLKITIYEDGKKRNFAESFNNDQSIDLESVIEDTINNGFYSADIKALIDVSDPWTLDTMPDDNGKFVEYWLFKGANTQLINAIKNKRFSINPGWPHEWSIRFN